MHGSINVMRRIENCVYSSTLGAGEDTHCIEFLFGFSFVQALSCVLFTIAAQSPFKASNTLNSNHSALHFYVQDLRGSCARGGRRSGQPLPTAPAFCTCSLGAMCTLTRSWLSTKGFSPHVQSPVLISPPHAKPVSAGKLLFDSVQCMVCHRHLQTRMKVILYFWTSNAPCTRSHSSVEVICSVCLVCHQSEISGKCLHHVASCLLIWMQTSMPSLLCRILPPHHLNLMGGRQ